MREIVTYLTRLRLCQDKVEKLKQREVNILTLVLARPHVVIA